MIVNPVRIFATLFLVAVGVSAQSTCVLTCLQGALSSNTCSSLTDTTCLCTNTTFQSAVAACLTKSCSAADQASAQALQQSQCGSSSGSSSGAGSSTSSSKSSTSPGTSTSTSSASSSTPTTNGAVHGQVPFFNAAFALATVALGGAFIL
ncbi:hypothetical protein EDB86DRAFT_2407863 [Lactarius hatsudake]|nr:hypothetical protein EDB86DRAFT_2407863 [Lactarius hatsudake]